MQKLNTLWQIVSAASSVRDLTQQTRTYHFGVTGPVTFFLQTENAQIKVMRWPKPQIEVTVKLQGSFGWRIAAEQDDAGVYIAAKRRTVVGGFSSASFEILLPHYVYLSLKLAECGVLLDNLTTTLNLPPLSGDVIVER